MRTTTCGERERNRRKSRGRTIQNVLSCPCFTIWIETGFSGAQIGLLHVLVFQQIPAGAGKGDACLLYTSSAWGPQSAFPRPPDARDAGLGHGTGVRRGWGTTHSSPVCAAAAGVSNGHAHPAVVSRLDWQNRGSRCEISGRAKAEDISSQGRLPAARKAFPPQGGRCHGGCRDG